MSRQLDIVREEKQARRDQAVLLALEGGLEEAIEYAGALLLGFSVALRGEDCLITLRVDLSGRKQIAFIGAADLPGCLLKAVREARADRLVWKDCKYNGQ